MIYNFDLPIDFTRLENDRLMIVLLEDNFKEWSKIYVQDGVENPHIYDYLTWGPFDCYDDWVEMYNAHFPNNPSEQLFAILLKAGTVTQTDPTTGKTTTFEVADGTFAGFSGLACKIEHATAGMGLMLLSKFQRTFVSTHVNGLTLHYLLDSAAEGGLGFRRVEWQCNASNKASIHTAKRMGFQWEGITRWQQVLPVGKKGSEGAEIEMKGLPKTALKGRDWGAGRHTANLSLCWDDWRNGGRDHVDMLMKRQ